MPRGDAALPKPPENQLNIIMKRYFSKATNGQSPFRKKPSAVRHLWRRLYLFEVDPDIASSQIFQRANPRYVPGMTCFYAGSTSQEIETRFQEHKSGGRNASKVVRGLCGKLRMDLVSSAGKKFPRERALKEEARLARNLRSQGFGVWQA
jgi:predicted GIY-YIG superfamily endonuclease